MCWRANIPGRAQRGHRGALLWNYRGDLEVSTAPAAQAADESVRGGGERTEVAADPAAPRQQLAGDTQEPTLDRRGRSSPPFQSVRSLKPAASGVRSGPQRRGVAPAQHTWRERANGSATHILAGGDDVTTARRLPAAETALPASSSPVRDLLDTQTRRRCGPCVAVRTRTRPAGKPALNHQNTGDIWD